MSRIVGSGYHDVYIRWDISTPQAVVGRLQELPGTGDLTRGRKLFAERQRFGKGWDHLLEPHQLLTFSGEHPASRGGGIWRRLEVQTHLGNAGDDAENDLCSVSEFDSRWLGLQQRMAMIGVLPPDIPRVTRIDVAVDVEFGDPQDGNVTLEALRFARWPNGWYAEWQGAPPYTTVAIKAQTKTVGRVYCRNSKLRNGKARWGKLRFEVEQVHQWKDGWSIDWVGNAAAPEMIWEHVFGVGRPSGRVTRIERERQTMTLIQRVRLGEMTYSQFERMTAFLDAERLGMVDLVYTADQSRARRREARTLGVCPSDTEYPEFDQALDEILAVPRSAWSTPLVA